MRVSKIICDGCGKEIHGNPIHIYAEAVDRDNGYIVDGGLGYAPNKDFCENCFSSIQNFIDKVVAGLVKEDNPVMEEPAPEEIEEPPVEVEEEPVEIEEPKQEPEPKQEKKPDSSKEPKKPSIRDLVLQGLSKEEVCRKTGCTPLTYDQTKYQLRKKGLLLLPGETVKCSEVHDTCLFADSKDLQCNFIIDTNKMRGCPAEACNRYVKKQGK